MAKRFVKKKRRKTRSGCLPGAILLLAALLVVVLLVSLSSCRREIAATPAVDALWDGTSWYQDDLGRIGEDKALIKGMETFEKRTGIRPFLTLLADVDPEELDVFVQDQHEALFAGGQQLLVVYDEWEEGVYYLAARAGEGSGLSREDQAKVLACLEAAYADPANDSYAAAFGAGFARGATEVTDRVSAGSGIGLLLVLGLLLLLLSALMVLLLRRRARMARRKERYMEDED